MLTRDDEHVSVLVPVVGPVAGGAVTDREPRGLVANQLKIYIVLYFILEGRKNNEKDR